MNKKTKVITIVVSVVLVIVLIGAYFYGKAPEQVRDRLLAACEKAQEKYEEIYEEYPTLRGIGVSKECVELAAFCLNNPDKCNEITIDRW